MKQLVSGIPQAEPAEAAHAAMPFVNNGQFDAAILASMGYDQLLARGIRNWVMSAAFCFVAIGTVPYVSAPLGYM